MAPPSASEEYPKFILCGLEAGSPFRGQLASCAIDVKVEHRHCGLEWSCLAALAGFRGSLERARDRERVVPGEYAGFEIQRVTVLYDVLRPALLLTG